MSKRFNEKLLLWGLGVAQPASLEEVVLFLRHVYPSVTKWPDKEQLEIILEEWISKKYCVLLNKTHRICSLTAYANHKMDIPLRRHRDKARLTLLRAAYNASVYLSEGAGQELGGDSPSVSARLYSQEGSRPVSSGLPPSRMEPTRQQARAYWPRVIEQLDNSVGFDFCASDTNFSIPAIPILRYKYLSFPSLKSLQEASIDKALERDMTLSQFALALGVSPRLITSFTHKPDNHYRTFSIPKKGGGDRVISSPRFFLKSVQYWIKTYFVSQLHVHDSCHAYVSGRSIATNAKQHVGKGYVANVDIENFFGSISTKNVYMLCINHGFGKQLSLTISKLVTLHGSLPQGAPTSPHISNAFLYDFDEMMQELCLEKGVSYTRYADDITFSGESKEVLLALIGRCESFLSRKGLSLKKEKTRIASAQASQRVTGLVVNSAVNPPREYRRRVRAMFHRAFNHPGEYVDRVNELKGHLSYLSSFESVRDTAQFDLAKEAISKVEKVSSKAKNQ